MRTMRMECGDKYEYDEEGVSVLKRSSSAEHTMSGVNRQDCSIG